MEIRPVAEGDLDQLLPLMRGYCEFYGTDPSDEALLELSRWLLEHPEDGVQTIAVDDEGQAIGFATIYWTWRTMHAARIAVLEDVYVSPAARGGGVAGALIEDARGRARERGAVQLDWQTAKTNERAQRAYAALGAEPDDRWLDYSVPTRRLE
ncbi:MAG TPA: GNAT family N-acetyltransferase [Solirubrobacterales bacterium]|nr:GNAT family N-acetyltransferase [Solirubrobacterales bacterium]